MGMEGCGLGRFKGLFQYLPGTTEKTPQNPTGRDGFLCDNLSYLLIPVICRSHI
jgi:hypothetical protein